MTNDNLIESVEKSIRRELSRICSCTPDSLPASLSTEQAAEYFNVSNVKTFNVWKSTGRHGLVWMKRGRRAEIATESAIQHRLKSMTIPGQVV